MAEKQLSKSRLRDFLLDEALCPVSRMRLFSDGVHPNTRLFQYDVVIGDRACLACGNCVDACPVVRDKQRFVFLQNQRTSMALENIVGAECRRCYRCIQACPQVSKTNKEYAAGFRRGEKVVHFLLGFTIILLALTGITTLHYGDVLSGFENGLFKSVHKLLGAILVLLPLTYFFIDRRHLFRLFRKVFKWNAGDNRWIQDLIRHIRDSRRYPLPHIGEFNPGQKVWYLYLIGVLPILMVTGIMLTFGLDDSARFGYLMTKFIHLFFALTTDLMLFVHIYLKYLRRWAVNIRDIVKVYLEKRHLNYAELYGRQ